MIPDACAMIEFLVMGPLRLRKRKTHHQIQSEELSEPHGILGGILAGIPGRASLQHLLCFIEEGLNRFSTIQSQTGE